MASLTCISSMATKQILADLARIYAEHSGIDVEVDSVGGVVAAKRVREGDVADIVVLASDVMQVLDTEGHLLPESRADFARSGIAIAVREGHRLPSIEDENAVRQATLAASKVCYSTGPSGVYLQGLWKRWGIGDAMASRAIQTPPGVPVAQMIADGTADLGFQQLSELLHQPGIAVVGPLPPAIQEITVFTAGVGARTSQTEAARKLLDFLLSPDAAGIKRTCGMQPP